MAARAGRSREERLADGSGRLSVARASARALDHREGVGPDFSNGPVPSVPVCRCAALLAVRVRVGCCRVLVYCARTCAALGGCALALGNQRQRPLGRCGCGLVAPHKLSRLGLASHDGRLQARTFTRQTTAAGERPLNRTVLCRYTTTSYEICLTPCQDSTDTTARAVASSLRAPPTRTRSPAALRLSYPRRSSSTKGPAPGRLTRPASASASSEAARPASAAMATRYPSVQRKASTSASSTP
eukprot:scaffold34556_cov129-Isochrysis_galbana.AAC.7